MKVLTEKKGKRKNLRNRMKRKNKRLQRNNLLTIVAYLSRIALMPRFVLLCHLNTHVFMGILQIRTNVN
jgi:hypothetical protein